MTDEIKEEEGKLTKIVKTYAKIRDKRAEIKKAYDAEDGGLKEELDILKTALLDYCRTQGVDSVKTPAGMFYRSKKSSYWTADWESLYAFIKEHDVPALLERRISQKHLREYLEENPDVMPMGLQSKSEYTISVRKNKK